MASKDTEDGGYDLNWIEEPSDELKCLICLYVARVPYQHGDEQGCGRVFCRNCITKFKKQQSVCPACRRRLRVFMDQRSEKTLV